MTTQEIIDAILHERSRQEAKWGQQNHAPVIWVSILTEEVGEAATEANKSHWADSDLAKRVRLANYQDELVQVAAVAIAMIESLNRNERNAQP